MHQDRQNHELNLRYKINDQQGGQETNVKPEEDEVIQFRKNNKRNKVKYPEDRIQSQWNKEQQTETVKQNLNMTTTPNLHKAPHMQTSDERQYNTTNRVKLVQSTTSEVTPPPPAIPLPTQQTRAIPSLLDIKLLPGIMKPLKAKKEAMPEPPCQKMRKKRNR
jgi:hypothetical protein